MKINSVQRTTSNNSNSITSRNNSLAYEFSPNINFGKIDPNSVPENIKDLTIQAERNGVDVKTCFTEMKQIFEKIRDQAKEISERLPNK